MGRRYAAPMNVTRSADAPDLPFEQPTFSGPVSRRDYGTVEHPRRTALVVSFPAGVRTDWHSHPDGQILYIVEGTGRVGTRDGAVAEVTTGDLVVAPPDEEHWHGASEEEPMRHLALSFGDTAWQEPVQDA
jgi:quercetin dioxygenase-like cupin family protein